MKFSGLILLCASSCLALLLPALGVVKFPMHPIEASGASRVNAELSLVGSPNLGSPLQTSPLQSSSLQTHPQSSALPPSLHTSAVLTQATLPPSSMANQTAAIPTIAPLTSTDPTAEQISFFGPPWSTQKVGMGVWLLLGPMAFLGLVLWTVAPNHRGEGRAATKA